MNIQTEKPELIKRLTRVDETERLLTNPDLVKKVRKARKEIKEGKGVKLDIKYLWNNLRS